MATAPLRAFGHSHAHVGELVLELAELLFSNARAQDLGDGETLCELAMDLREELLEHFANEEEGLFPFIRENVPSRSDAVERLEAAHDSICGALVRFSYFAARDGELPDEARAIFERFQSAYANHSREEADLLDELERVLTATQHAELALLLRGLHA
jgi:iron-sulfur cluster repair protein YtfE (RIC family)